MHDAPTWIREALRDSLHLVGSANDAEDRGLGREAAGMRTRAAAALRALLDDHPVVRDLLPDLATELDTGHIFGFGWTNLLDLFLVPFVDLGRIWTWNPIVPDQGLHVHPTGGAAFRFAWNRDFVVRFDVGFAPEDTLEGCAAAGHALSTGFYVTTDHPF